jgi:hypothetical protein
VEFAGKVQASPSAWGSSFITVTIPAGARTGPVKVITGSTTLTSLQDFTVLPGTYGRVVRRTRKR